jgi:hypothetical protein
MPLTIFKAIGASLAMIAATATISEAQSCCRKTSAGVALGKQVAGRSQTFGARCMKGGACTPIACTNYQQQVGIGPISGNYSGSYEVVTFPYVRMNYCGPAPIVAFCETDFEICGKMRFWVGIAACPSVIPDIPGAKPMYFEMPYGKSTCKIPRARPVSTHGGQS